LLTWPSAPLCSMQLAFLSNSLSIPPSQLCCTCPPPLVLFAALLVFSCYFIPHALTRLLLQLRRLLGVPGLHSHRSLGHRSRVRPRRIQPQRFSERYCRICLPLFPPCAVLVLEVLSRQGSRPVGARVLQRKKVTLFAAPQENRTHAGRRSFCSKSER
jgi:hypothetical protein